MSLPANLVDSVVDLLKSDIPALKVTSILSRQWLPRSRHYLFSSIWLHGGWSKALAERVADFLTLISSPMATFIPFVLELHVKFTWAQAYDVPNLVLAMLEKHGVRPKRLHLDCYHQVMLLPLKRPAFWSSLVYLDIQMKDNNVVMDDIIHYICAFPFLETLRIGGEPKGVDRLIPVRAVLPLRLHTLQAGNLLVLEWLLSPSVAVGHRAQQITNLELFHLRFGSPWVDVPSKYVESLTFDECYYGSCTSLLYNAKYSSDRFNR